MFVLLLFIFIFTLENICADKLQSDFLFNMAILFTSYNYYLAILTGLIKEIPS